MANRAIGFLKAVNISQVSQLFYDATGYTLVDAQKKAVADAHTDLRERRNSLQVLQDHFDNVSNEHVSVTEELQTMLMRRSKGWSPADTNRFAELVGRDEALGQNSRKAKEDMFKALNDVFIAIGTYTDALFERYSAEQAWSERVRRAATWWTWALIGANLATTAMVYGVIEPARRERMKTDITQALMEGVRAEGAKTRELLARSLGNRQAVESSHAAAESKPPLVTTSGTLLEEEITPETPHQTTALVDRAKLQPRSSDQLPPWVDRAKLKPEAVDSRETETLPYEGREGWIDFESAEPSRPVHFPGTDMVQKSWSWLANQPRQAVVVTGSVIATVSAGVIWLVLSSRKPGGA